mmetsp:Transcript_115/g.317  ORF Transcript_115/g.317 Transcript_115/m.317 type:complete len:230 (-) Transcript_115:182-871(-)
MSPRITPCSRITHMAHSHELRKWAASRRGTTTRPVLMARHMPSPSSPTTNGRLGASGSGRDDRGEAVEGSGEGVGGWCMAMAGGWMAAVVMRLGVGEVTESASICMRILMTSMGVCRGTPISPAADPATTTCQMGCCSRDCFDVDDASLRGVVGVLAPALWMRSIMAHVLPYAPNTNELRGRLPSNGGAKPRKKVRIPSRLRACVRHCEEEAKMPFDVDCSRTFSVSIG